MSTDREVLQQLQTGLVALRVQVDSLIAVANAQLGQPPVDPPPKPVDPPPVTGGPYVLRDLGAVMQSHAAHFDAGTVYAFPITSSQGGFSMTQAAGGDASSGPVDICISPVAGDMSNAKEPYGGTGFNMESSGASWAPVAYPVSRAIVPPGEKWFINVRLGSSGQAVWGWNTF